MHQYLFICNVNNVHLWAKYKQQWFFSTSYGESSELFCFDSGYLIISYTLPMICTIYIFCIIFTVSLVANGVRWKKSKQHICTSRISGSIPERGSWTRMFVSVHYGAFIAQVVPLEEKYLYKWWLLGQAWDLGILYTYDSTFFI